MIAAEAEAMGLGAALVVEWWDGEVGERGWEGGACRWPGGPIPLGYDGAYGGWCDSWDSYVLSCQARRDVSGFAN